MIRKKSISHILPLPRLFLLFSILLVTAGVLITWYLTLTSGSGEIRQQASTEGIKIEYDFGYDTPSEPEFFPDVLLVKMKDSQPGVRVASNPINRISQLDATDVSLVTMQVVPEIENLSLINFDESLEIDLEQAITDLQSDPDVEYAEKIYKIKAFSVNDPYYKKTGKTVLEHFQWNFDRIKVKEAWEALGSKGDSGVTVAVIDTGVAFKDYTDPDTGTVYTQSPELVGVSFVSPRKYSSDGCEAGFSTDGPLVDNEHALDDGGHGTHVASTIVQATNNNQHAAGIAPGVKLMPINVFTKCPENDDAYTNTYDLILGINHAVSNGADVINMSLGINTTALSQLQTLREAIQSATNQGVVVVAAAGNSVTSTSSPPIAVPAAFPETIAVGATRHDNARAHYSQHQLNNGKGIDVMAPGGEIVDKEGYVNDQNDDYLFDGIVQQTIMPGDPEHFTQITALQPSIHDYFCIEIDGTGATGYFSECGLYQGTSMAAPHVSAVVALMLSANPDLTVAEVKSILKSTANKNLPNYNELEYGAGLIDAKEAVIAAQALVGGGQITCSEVADCDDEIECTTDLCLNPGTTNSSCQHQERTGESCNDGQGLCVANAQCQDLGENTLISLQASLDGVPYCELGGTSCTTKSECASGQFCVNGKCGNCFPPQTAGQTVTLQATFVSAKKPAITREVVLTYDPSSLSYVTVPANNIRV